MYSKKYIYIFSICLMTFLSFSVMGQDNDIDKKNFSEDLLTIYNPWIATHNYSGLYFYGQEKISEIVVGFNNTNGDYVRSMDPADINQLSIGTYSFQKYKKMGLYGKFEYINSYEDNVKWCDVMNPYNGNPFILGDDVGGDFHKEFFHLAGGISSALFGDSFIWGVGVDYLSGTGGKDNDPRPLNKIMKAEIKPGILFDFNDIRLGFNFDYSYAKEEVDIKAFVDNENYKIYKFRGFGLYTFDEVTDFDRNYFSNKYGGNMQVGFSIGAIENITELGFFYKNDEIEDGSSVINDFALFEEENISIESNFIYKNDNFIHNLVLSGKFYDRIGTVNVERKELEGFVNVWKRYGENRDYTQKVNNLSLYYSIFNMKSKYVQNWKAEIKAEYFDHNSKYKFDPEVLEEDFQNMDINAAFTKDFTMGKKSMIAINLNGGYRFNLDNKLYVLNDSNKDALLIDDISEFMVENIVKTDNEWATNDVVQLGGFIKYAVDTNFGKRSNSTYLKLSADYSTVNSGMFDGENRTNLTATLGIVF